MGRARGVGSEADGFGLTQLAVLGQDLLAVADPATELLGPAVASSKAARSIISSWLKRGWGTPSRCEAHRAAKCARSWARSSPASPKRFAVPDES